mmetsp:Transcript_22164/g.78993  ORF Transcript_22164/g.78993 Transcript_22164/m.78993 type:complete len:151 (-) Transcript_22164:171-623(-)
MPPRGRRRRGARRGPAPRRRAPLLTSRRLSSRWPQPRWPQSRSRLFAAPAPVPRVSTTPTLKDCLAAALSESAGGDAVRRSSLDREPAPPPSSRLPSESQRALRAKKRASQKAQITDVTNTAPAPRATAKATRALSVPRPTANAPRVERF